jgi:hypothetical protein
MLKAKRHLLSLFPPRDNCGRKLLASEDGRTGGINHGVARPFSAVGF